MEIGTVRDVRFEPVGSFDLVALEARQLERWEREDIFHESLRRREGADEWVFYEGPPFANGRPGIHHVWARIFKDLYPRFHTMRGRSVPRKGGWDCHGLPVEIEVERELGFSDKHEIERYGIREFNARCRDSVRRYVGDWEELTRRIGMWLDTDDAYWTLSNEYMESVWWQFRQLWDRGHVYEGHKVVPYCGRCGTALSSHELAKPCAYRDVTEPSVFVRFPIEGRNFDLLVWTTTPWTLVSNVALAVHPDVEYVRVHSPRRDQRDVVLARELVSTVYDDAEVVEPVSAADLVGLRYERPFADLGVESDAFRVVAADFVTVDEGTGIVHLAPAFGEVDREVAEREGLAMLNPVDDAARFDSSFPRHQGSFVKDADEALIEELRASGRLEKTLDYTHSYPHCWRCETPLVYWAKPNWFVRTSAQRAALLRENEKVGWHPGHIKEGRFGDWLRNNVDWALSRDRFWGTPIPVWRCEQCGHDACIGSVAELAERSGRDLEGLDLHRPFVDEVSIPCESCGAPATRVESVLDVWFDSGAMPAAQLHVPFEHEDVFERRYPAEFICEAIDQTRGWFYSLLAVNTLVFGSTPYRNVVCLSLILDRDGQKMSKSRGNVVDPWSILDRRGADALRWYFFTAGSPWTPKRVYEEGIDESTRRFLLTVWNTYSFFVTYANLDAWEPRQAPRGPRHVLDRWVRSRLQRTIGEVTTSLDGFDALAAANALDRFVDDLSNWYVRRSRSRFWRDPEGSGEAHATLHECLVTVATLLAPFTPFVADELFRNLSGPGAESVHLADWPTPDESALDEELEHRMAHARAIVSLGRSAREDARVSVRQPLARALVVTDEPLADDVVAEVEGELNVKQIELVADLEGLLDYTVVPNFRALGPRLGPRLPKVQAVLGELDGATARQALEDRGRLLIELDGESVELGPEDVEIRAVHHEELAIAQEGRLAVALDLALDDQLRAEGRARALARALNEARKHAGLELADRVGVVIAGQGPIVEAARQHGEWIAGEVLAVGWSVTDTVPDGAEALKIGDETIRVVLERR